MAEQGKTVQEYLDETPFWSDGTQAPFNPMTEMQWRIWGLATAGKFFEGLVVFMTGVVLPLVVQEFHLDASGKGAAGAASLVGILVGASVLGHLSDKYGRKAMFITEMIIFTLFLTLIVFSNGFWWFLACLFGMGVALGCDYPTAHMIISESIPSNNRGRLVLGAFAFQAVGALAGTGIGYLILSSNPTIGAWRWMYATAIIPAVIVVVARFFITDSGHWLVSRGRIPEAEKETERLLRRVPPYPKKVRLVAPEGNGSPESEHGSYSDLFRGKGLRASILSSVPWFLQDLSTYGIGIFTPTILASVLGAEVKYARNITDIIHNDMLAAKGAAFIDVLLLVGVLFAVALADRVGRMKLQIFGFVGSAIGLFLASLSMSPGGGNDMVLLYAGFMLFSFMTNIGPNAMTYLVAGEVFPTAVRGKGAGFAASVAKIGAVLTAFLFPIMLKDIGTQTLLYALVGTSLLGAVVTWLWRIETMGVSLEDV